MDGPRTASRETTPGAGGEARQKPEARALRLKLTKAQTQDEMKH